MPNNNNNDKTQNQDRGPQKYDPSQDKKRQPQSDKGMNKRETQKDLDDEGSPVAKSDDDIDTTSRR